MRARTEIRHQGGFTLLEMLVALTVLGFLMVGLNEGVRTGLGMWSRQARQIGRSRNWIRPPASYAA